MGFASNDTVPRRWYTAQRLRALADRLDRLVLSDAIDEKLTRAVAMDLRAEADLLEKL